MAKKSKSRSSAKSTSKSGNRFAAKRMDARAAEVVSARIGKLLQNKEFSSSLEEAGNILQERTINSIMFDSDFEPEDDLERAQNLMWKAFDEPAAHKRVKMTREALKLSPDCADAYVLLAEDDARTPEKEIAYYRQGVDAGRRALAGMLDDEKTQFWSDLKTRPYMRALDGLAFALYCEEEFEEAIEFWSELLRLNPQDHQGVRYALVPVLIELDQLSEAEAILKRYQPDITACFAYSWALLLFKKFGASPAADVALKDAIERNSFVLQIMLGQENLPSLEYSQFAPGSVEEADQYVTTAIGSWIQTSGAMAWVADMLMRCIRQRRLNRTFPDLNANVGENNVIPFDVKSRE